MPYSNQDQKRAYQLVWMWRRRLTWILENGPCSQCGSVRDLSVVHKDPKEKTKRVTSIWSLSEAKAKVELEKCVVLCKDCVLAKRKIERNVPAEHGTDRRYGQGCKCVECRAAHAASNRQRRALNGRKPRAKIVVKQWTPEEVAHYWKIPVSMVNLEPVEDRYLKVR